MSVPVTLRGRHEGCGGSVTFRPATHRRELMAGQAVTLRSLCRECGASITLEYRLPQGDANSSESERSGRHVAHAAFGWQGEREAEQQQELPLAAGEDRYAWTPSTRASSRGGATTRVDHGSGAAYDDDGGSVTRLSDWRTRPDSSHAPHPPVRDELTSERVEARVSALLGPEPATGESASAPEVHPPTVAGTPGAPRRTPGLGETAYSEQFARRFEAARAAVRRVREELPEVLSAEGEWNAPRFAVPQLSTRTTPDRAPRAGAAPAAAATPHLAPVAPSHHAEEDSAVDLGEASRDGAGSNQQQHGHEEPQAQPEQPQDEFAPEAYPHVPEPFTAYEPPHGLGMEAMAVAVAEQPAPVGDLAPVIALVPPVDPVAPPHADEAPLATALAAGAFEIPDAVPVPPAEPVPAAEPSWAHLTGEIPQSPAVFGDVLMDAAAQGVAAAAPPAPAPQAFPAWPAAAAVADPVATTHLGPPQPAPDAPDPGSVALAPAGYAHPQAAMDHAWHGALAPEGPGGLMEEGAPRGFDWGGETHGEAAAAQADEAGALTGAKSGRGTKTRLQVMLVALVLVGCVGVFFLMVRPGASTDDATFEIAAPKPAAQQPADAGGKAGKAAPAEVEGEAPVGAAAGASTKVPTKAPPGAETADANGLAQAADNASDAPVDPFAPA